MGRGRNRRGRRKAQRFPAPGVLGEDVQVADGIRTRDRRDHNPELYQLSYRHRAPAQDTVHASTAP